MSTHDEISRRVLQCHDILIAARAVGDETRLKAAEKAYTSATKEFLDTLSTADWKELVREVTEPSHPLHRPGAGPLVRLAARWAGAPATEHVVA